MEQGQTYEVNIPMAIPMERVESRILDTGYSMLLGYSMLAKW